MSQDIIQERQQQVLYDKKWKKFLRRAWLFGHIPFVDFVLAAGSMAIGNVQPESDFDVIIGVKQGRIFTTRFFCVLAFELFGWRRRKEHFSAGGAKDKFCFNHFVTPRAYRLSPPHSPYWKALYKNLVPVFGGPSIVRQFWNANADWLGELVNYRDDLRHKYRKPALTKKFLEFILANSFGAALEKLLKHFQIKKIQKSLESDRLGFEPRIKYNDTELEFHPDTARMLSIEKNFNSL